jgi:hypothetical protein
MKNKKLTQKISIEDIPLNINLVRILHSKGFLTSSEVTRACRGGRMLFHWFQSLLSSDVQYCRYILYIKKRQLQQVKNCFPSFPGKFEISFMPIFPHKRRTIAF